MLAEAISDLYISLEGHEKLGMAEVLHPNPKGVKHQNPREAFGSI